MRMKRMKKRAFARLLFCFGFKPSSVTSMAEKRIDSHRSSKVNTTKLDIIAEAIESKLYAVVVHSRASACPDSEMNAPAQPVGNSADTASLAAPAGKAGSEQR
jgi:hypothetical protein